MPKMKRTQLPKESKLTDFFSKKPKTVSQSPSVLTEQVQPEEQQSAAVALETVHLECPCTSTPSTETAFPDIWTTDQWAQKNGLSLVGLP